MIVVGGTSHDGSAPDSSGRILGYRGVTWFKREAPRIMRRIQFKREAAGQGGIYHERGRLD
jgi:hypothetical protein